MRRFPILFVVLPIVLSAAAANAQPHRWSGWSGYLAGGFNSVTGEAGDALDNGIQFLGGATYRPDAWPFALAFEVGYNNQDIRREVFGRFDGRLNGDVTNWSFSAGPMLSLGRDAPIGFYVLGTVGAYRRVIDLTTPSIGWVPPICSRWYPWCRPGGWVPVDRVVARDSSTSFGYSAGFGLTFSMPNETQLFVEARYHRAQTSPEATEFIPVTFGWRF